MARPVPESLMDTVAVVRIWVSEAQPSLFAISFLLLINSSLLRHFWDIEESTSNSDVGAKIAEHAIVSLSEMLANNPTIQRPGSVPYLGSTLKLNWGYFVALMVVILAFDSLTSILGLVAICNNPESQSERYVRLQDIHSEQENV